eukprot:5851582-Alexandrium_andersonii.AAC.1
MPTGGRSTTRGGASWAMAASGARSAGNPSRLGMGGPATGATRMSVAIAFVASVSRSTLTQSGRRRVAWSRRNGSSSLSSRMRPPA